MSRERKAWLNGKKGESSEVDDINCTLEVKVSFYANLFILLPEDVRIGRNLGTIITIMVASKPQTNTFQWHKVYGVSLISALESLTFIILYGWLISELGEQLDDVDQGTAAGMILNSTRIMAATMVAVSGLRLFIAMALLMKSYKTLMTFYIATQAGILVNLSTGFIGSYSLNTYGIGLATLCVIGLHVVYITVIHGVINRMRVKLLRDLENAQLARRVRAARPAAVNISAVPPEQNFQREIKNPEGLHSPNNIDNNIDSDAPPDYTQAPPSYAAEFGDGPHNPITEKFNKF